MVKMRKKKKKGLGEDGLSHYARKQQRLEEIASSTQEIASHSEQGHNYKNGWIETKTGITVGICFLPNPKAIMICPYGRTKTENFLFKEFHGKIRYSTMSYSGKTALSYESFSDIYKIPPQTTSQGKKELDAIREMIELKHKDIETHTGLKFKI